MKTNKVTILTVATLATLALASSSQVQDLYHPPLLIYFYPLDCTQH